MRASTSGGCTHGSGHSRPPSSVHLRVASTPIFPPRPMAGAAWSRMSTGPSTTTRSRFASTLPGARQAVHELLRVAGVLLPHRDQAEVVEDALGREGHVHDLGEDELEHGEE